MSIHALETQRWNLANAAIEKSEPALLEQAAQINAELTVERFYSRVLEVAIKKNSIPILRYLVEHGVSVEHIEPREVAADGEVSIPTLEFLLARGWDINWPGCRVNAARKPFMWYCVNHRDKLVWCLEHGAKLKRPKMKRCKGPDEPPILQIVAREGDIATFEFLRSKGAPLRPHHHINEVLHAAVKTAACGYRASADPEKDNEEERKSRARWNQSMEMVRYLIDVVGFDVNAPDNPPECKKCRSGEWGTPLQYVQQIRIDGRSQRELTWLLLDRGADPTPALEEAEYDRRQGWHNYEFFKNIEDWGAQGGREKLRQREEQKAKERGCCVH